MVARHACALDALLVSETFDGDVYLNEPLSRHTTYHIGGPARYFVQVGSLGALKSLVEACSREGVPWMPFGRGSNVLVSDEGFDGVMVLLGRDFRTCRYDEAEHRFYVGAGVALSTVVQEAFHRSLAGLEFAVGTPGTAGGALRMNAGSRDTWIGNQVVSVTSYSVERGFIKRSGAEVQWGYRSSSFAPDEIILECTLAVEPADPFFIRGKMESNLAKRRNNQPLSSPSCGSVFKNPKGQSAAVLVEGAGCKGLRIGGAQVSEKHANFIVNENEATAHDVRSLMELVQAKVYKRYGIQLQTEVKFVGFAS